MNIYTVRDNLKKTIVGKELCLAEWKNAALLETGDRIHRATFVGMLELNIDELKRILTDVEVCCEQHNEMSWTINPERMGQ